MQNKSLVEKKSTQWSPLILGFIFGIVFGFLLQKGGVTKYDVIVGQLLLTDFTVLKIMLTAVIVGMPGIYLMKQFGWVELYPKSGSVGMNVIGGLIFGVGFALLGYCPGTIAGAIGNGYLDAAIGGLAGIWIGTGSFAALYPRLNDGILKIGDYGDISLPKLLKMNEWVVIGLVEILIIVLLIWLERMGL
jgi:hypothetical protein